MTQTIDSGLKHIVVNDEPYLVEEEVWHFILTLSKEKDAWKAAAKRLRGRLADAIGEEPEVADWPEAEVPEDD